MAEDLSQVQRHLAKKPGLDRRYPSPSNGMLCTAPAGAARPDTPDFDLSTAHALGRNARRFRLWALLPCSPSSPCQRIPQNSPPGPSGVLRLLRTRPPLLTLYSPARPTSHLPRQAPGLPRPSSSSRKPLLSSQAPPALPAQAPAGRVQTERAVTTYVLEAYLSCRLDSEPFKGLGAPTF